MAVLLPDLRAYVNATSNDDAFIQSCLTEANTLVDNYIGTADVPTEVRDRAVKECGSELFHRRQAPNGIAQFSTFEAAPIRVARDPMVGAYPLLASWVGGGFA